MEAECQDALLHWLGTFTQDADEIIENPESILDGVFLSTVYNQLVEENDKINIDSLKKPKDANDWVAMMMNMRQIAGKILPIVKENGYDTPIDFNELARKKNHDELYSFLRYFLYFSVKAPNRKHSIENIRTLEKQYMSGIQTLLKEFTQKKQQKEEVKPEQVKTEEKKEENNDEEKKKILLLDEEIAQLKAKKAKLDDDIAAAEKNKASNNDNSNSLNDALNDAKRRHQAAKEKRDKLQTKLDDASETLSKLRTQLDQLREQQKKLMTPVAASENAEKNNKELKEKLESLKAEIVDEVKKDAKIAAEMERNPPKEVDDYVKLLGVQALDAKIQELKREFDATQKTCQMKEADLKCYAKKLEEQNKKSSIILRKKIAQLNAKIDASQIGDAKRMTIKYQKVIRKLESDIETLKAGCSQMEAEELQKQLTILASRKAMEGDLFAKKQSFIQSTAEQCDIRLERIKLNVALQMHSSRIAKWKNCFTTPNKQ